MKYFILKWSLEKKQNNKTKRSLWCRLLHKMIAPLSANPDFDDKIEDVTLWFIEYDDVVNHIANREIGFAKDGRIIVKMPDDRNYGYWLDTNCELDILFIIKTVYLKFLCRLSTKSLHITHSTKKSTLSAYLSPKKPLLMFIMHFVPRGFVSLCISYQKEISSLSNLIFT